MVGERGVRERGVRETELQSQIFYIDNINQHHAKLNIIVLNVLSFQANS